MKPFESGINIRPLTSDTYSILARTSGNTDAFAVFSNGTVNIGTATTTSQRLFRVGQDTAFVDIGSLIGAPSNAALYMNAATPSSINYTIRTNTSDTYFNAQGSISSNARIQVSGNDRIFVGGANQNLRRFEFSPANQTSNAASTELNGWLYNNYTKSYVVGTMPIIRENYWKSTLIDFTAPSVVSNAYANYYEALSGTTAVTFTTNYVAGFNGGDGISISAQTASQTSIQALVGTPTQPALYLGVANPSSTNYTLNWDGNIKLNSQTSTNGIILLAGGSARLTISSSDNSSSDSFSFTPRARTGIPTGTNTKLFRLVTSTQTWAGGNVDVISSAVFEAPTIAFASASTATSVYNLMVNSTIAGSNAFIQNNFAAGFVGDVSITGTTTTTGLSVSALTANTLYIKGIDTLSSTTNTQITNSGNTNIVRIFNNANVLIGTGSTTNQRILRVTQNTATLDIGSWVGLTANPALYFNPTTPDGNNYGLAGSNTITYLNAPVLSGSVIMRVFGNDIIVGTNTGLTFTPTVTNTGAVTNFTFTKPNNTFQNISTPINGFLYNLGTRSWLQGNITSNQSEVYYTQPVYSFGGVSTASNVSTMAIAGAPSGASNTSLLATSAFLIETGVVGTGVTTSYGAFINAQSGALTNIALAVSGGTSFSSNTLTGFTVTGPTAIPAFVVDTNVSRVGIGGIYPAFALDVIGKSTTDVVGRFVGDSNRGSSLRLTRGASYEWALGCGGGTGIIPASSFGIHDVGLVATRFFIAHSTGLVGINTIGPIERLDVNGNAYIRSGITATTLTISGNTIINNSNATSELFLVKSGTNLTIRNTGAGAAIYTDTVSLGLGSNSTVIFSLQTNGSTMQFADAKDIGFNATTGTKIGLSTTQKFAFWNNTPIIQPVSGTSINKVLSETGLIATGLTSYFSHPLGVGTSAPNGQLHVSGNTSGTLFRITNSAGNNGFVMDNGDLKSQFYGGGGISYPSVCSTASNQFGVGFSNTGVALVAASVARLVLSGSSGILLNGNQNVVGGINVYFTGNTVLENLTATTANFTGLTLGYRELNSDYAITANDYTMNITANTITVTLPTAVGATGRIYNVKNMGSGTVTLSGTSSQTIDENTTQSIIKPNSIKVQSTGANWIII